MLFEEKMEKLFSEFPHVSIFYNKSQHVSVLYYKFPHVSAFTYKPSIYLIHLCSHSLELMTCLHVLQKLHEKNILYWVYLSTVVLTTNSS